MIDILVFMKQQNLRWFLSLVMYLYLESRRIPSRVIQQMEGHSIKIN